MRIKEKGCQWQWTAAATWPLKKTGAAHAAARLAGPLARLPPLGKWGRPSFLCLAANHT